MNWIIRLYTFVLLGYTGYRTYDFMQNQLPQGEVGYFMALLFLFATEMGLLLWHEVSMKKTTTDEQEMVSNALVVIDFIGSTGAGIADMILRQTFVQGYAVPPLLGTLLIYGMPGVVALNVAGALYYQSHDAEMQIDKAQKKLRFAITKDAIKALRENQGNVAASMRQAIYEELKNNVVSDVSKTYLQNNLHQPASSQPLLTDEELEGIILNPNGNGAGGEEKQNFTVR